MLCIEFNKFHISHSNLNRLFFLYVNRVGSHSCTYLSLIKSIYWFKFFFLIELCISAIMPSVYASLKLLLDQEVTLNHVPLNSYQPWHIFDSFIYISIHFQETVCQHLWPSFEMSPFVLRVLVSEWKGYKVLTKRDWIECFFYEYGVMFNSGQDIW